MNYLTIEAKTCLTILTETKSLGFTDLLFHKGATVHLGKRATTRKELHIQLT
jgi:hypothetical protein